MPKGIIVVDIPIDCEQCTVYADPVHCSEMNGIDCPIKLPPKEKTVAYMDPKDPQGFMEASQAHGWNLCLEEILGGAADG